MIIWTGRGFLIFIVVFVCSLVMEPSTEAITKNDNYYQEQSWPLALAIAISGVIVLILEKTLLKDGSRVYIDKESGKEVSLETKHSLFFIPAKYWPYVLLAVSLVVLLFKKGAAT